MNHIIQKMGLQSASSKPPLDPTPTQRISEGGEGEYEGITARQVSDLNILYYKYVNGVSHFCVGHLRHLR